MQAAERRRTDPHTLGAPNEALSFEPMKTDIVSSPNPIDVHVGQRIRMRRKQLGLSQERLAADLDLTFQQIQKYERGSNRVSASKLYVTAQALQVPISYFFEGLNDPAAGFPDVADHEWTDTLGAFLATPEGYDLAIAFPKVGRGRIRRRILDLVRALADDDAAAARGQ